MSFGSAPPAYSTANDNNSARNEVSQPLRYTLYQSPVNGTNHSVQRLFLFDDAERRWLYAVQIPKKREGWKANVFFITEKRREEHRYEVRREPLARKFDFRPPNGVHNVMVPASFSSKSFSLEAPDGQRLSWRKSGSRDALLESLPSNTVIAKYEAFDPRRATPQVRGTEKRYDGDEVTLLGCLLITTFARSNEAATAPSRRKGSISGQSTTSTASSDAGPRLHGAYRSLAIGLCSPSVTGAAVASPWLAAAMNKHCLIGDDLSNLGKTSIVGVQDSRQRDVIAQASHQSNDSAMAAQAEYWASQNRIATKNADPRPRFVELDLILASLTAILST